MTPTLVAVLAGLLLAPADTTTVLHSVALDVTGDGRPEVLELLATAETPDSLEVVFVVRNHDGVLYEHPLRPLTRTTGFDAGRRELTAEAYRARVRDFGPWFFGAGKFRTAVALEAWLNESAPRHVAAIGRVIARDSEGRLDPAGGERVWQRMRARDATVFEFSPGGDALLAIAWSQEHRRFYRVLECC
ncbi:MAG: hypothetical protein RJQ04_19385 [Longimicrobiales bacterium]